MFPRMASPSPRGRERVSEVVEGREGKGRGRTADYFGGVLDHVAEGCSGVGSCACVGGGHAVWIVV